MNKYIVALVVALITTSSFSAEYFKVTKGWGASVSASTTPKYLDVEQGSGSDLVSNGTFANTNGWDLGTEWTVSGNTAIFTTANRFSNGTFANTNTWLFGQDWAVASGVAKYTGVAASNSLLSCHTVNMVSGTTYSVQYTVSLADGSFSIAPVIGASITGTLRTANGTYIENIASTQTGSNFTFQIITADAATAAVDNVSMRVAGLVTTNTITQQLPLLVGNLPYRVGYTVSGIDAGTNTLEVTLGTDSGGIVASDTIYTPSGYVDIKPTGASNINFTVVATNIGSLAISAVSVRQAPMPSKISTAIISVLPTDLPANVMYNLDANAFSNEYAVGSSIVVSSNASVTVSSTDGINRIRYRSASGTPTVKIVGY